MSAPNAGEWLDAFVAATDELATTTLGLEKSALSRNGDRMPTGRPGAYIGFVSEAASLQIGLLSTPEGCQSIAKALLGMAPTDEHLSDADLADALGEVVNIVAGSMKTHLAEKDPSIQLGLPFFVHGHIQTKSDMERAVADGTVGGLPISLIVLRQPHQ